MSDDLKTAFLAKADQAYADAQVQLDTLVGSLVDDMRDRREYTSTDAAYWASTTFGLADQINTRGKVNDNLIGVCMAAVYRLARQQVSL